jgi:hypothetical protein
MSMPIATVSESRPTPDLHLQTLFVLDRDGRITSTREPGGTRGPLFALVRGLSGRAWAVRADVPRDLADELDRLAREEPAVTDLQQAPLHAHRYSHLLRSRLPGVEVSQSGGPAFAFPEILAQPADGVERDADVALIEDEQLLQHHFKGWVPGEIAAGRRPVMAAMSGGQPISICFCARSSDIAAEAGLETAEPFRGRGLGPKVTAAWALAIRASGRAPLYSTIWTNHASRAVARKLGLLAYAASWSLTD